MKGRRKKPTETKELQGTAQPCRVNPNEPKPDKVEGVDCPEWFADNEVAFKTWQWATKTLQDMKILSVADLPTVEMFCLVYSEVRQLFLDLKEEGRVSKVVKKDSDGNEIIEAKANPKAVQFNNLMTQYRMFSSMLGFDPTSRPRLKAEDPEEDEFEKMFG